MPQGAFRLTHPASRGTSFSEAVSLPSGTSAASLLNLPDRLLHACNCGLSERQLWIFRLLELSTLATLKELVRRDDCTSHGCIDFQPRRTQQGLPKAIKAAIAGGSAGTIARHSTACPNPKCYLFQVMGAHTTNKSSLSRGSRSSDRSRMDRFRPIGHTNVGESRLAGLRPASE